MTEYVNTSKKHNEKIKEVWFSYLKWFMRAGILAFFASLAAHYLNIYLPCTGLQIRIIQIFSLVLEAGSLGQCGYGIQTWGEVSPAEKLNERLFTLFSSIGVFLIVFSFQLEPSQSV